MVRTLLVQMIGLALFCDSSFADVQDLIEARKTGQATYRYLPSKKPTRFYMVMLHGWGEAARYYDLTAAYLTYGGSPHALDPDPLLEDVAWVLPDGPIGVGSGSGSYSWYSRGKNQLKSMKRARDRLAQILAAEGIPEDKVIWAGFSQGAIMAVDAALHSAKKPAGLIIQAGAIDGTLAEWTPLLKSMKGLRYLQFHHVKDIDIPIDFGRELDEFLSIGGLKGELIEARKPYFDNHAIDPEVTSQPIAEFVDSLRAWTRRP